MRIFIQIPDNKRFEFDVSGSTTISELRYELSKRIGRSNISDFIFNGELLRDDKSLDYYDVEDGDMILAVPLYVAGGPPIVNETYSSNINCMDKRGKIGEFYGYKIIGNTEGTVWGDGIYTDDSNIAKAAVLEGKCKIGENCTVWI